MANNRVQVKRTSTAGRTPNTTSAGNTQYIAAGEFALNMSDQILYTSDGSNLITVGANLVNQRITNAVTIDNDKGIYWRTVNTSATVGMRQQTDDNFVFYTTNTTYGQRAVFSIFANSDTSAFSFSTPVTFNANVTKLAANGTTGSAGQVLTANGTGGVYWATAGAGSVNVDAQYIWTNNHTFNANVSYGNNIGLNTAKGIYFNLVSDANWRIGRNTAATTKFFYTGNTLDIIAANSALEGIALGYTGNAYLETGYAGTFTQNPLYVGNTTQNVSTTNTTITIQTNTTVNAAMTAALVRVSNSTSTANLTALDLKIGATTTVNSTQVTATLLVGNVSGSYANITGQVNTTTLYAATSANIASIVQANSLGVHVGANVVANTTTLRVGNTTITTTNTVLGGTVAANGGIGSAGQVLTSGAAGNVYWTTPTVGTVTSVATGVGLTGGPITSSGTVSVNPNTGIVANSTGVFVNSAYIATIASNSATFANASVTNAFTVGTAAYFVSNGNIGAGNNTPAHRLRVEGDLSLANGIHANGSFGIAGQVLTTNSTSVYWATAAGGGYYKGGPTAVGTLAGGGQNIFRVNANTLNTDTTIAAGENAQATGPLGITAGITLTIETGARVSIV